jgi:hypothetical protein
MRKNPFTVCGRIERCWLFVYRTPAEAAGKLLPAPLELVTRGGFAFWNIVVCRIAGLRPAPLPATVGLGYWHVAYRLHVRAPMEDGPVLEGLHFLRSDCDQPLVALAGNLITDFRFHRAGIRIEEKGSAVRGRIRAKGGEAIFRLNRQAPTGLSASSPFTSLAEAAEWLKYKPCGLSPAGGESVNAVRVIRKETAWRSRLVTVQEARWEFLALQETELELCYEVEPIHYQWERGRILRVRKCAS